ncbi:FtsX-like permease family protein [Protofrankia symbiont of Coriaria ruscifolia]|uniref:FtsX-like permease family protein n=1 Tax=Protofrankia symbiont of Coriaria ruscifolia TaxID=1306542 RepID=UPI001041242D|nr:ABC transporter permease [Protofrankia symbiont of Coriaria ruscifolia]
MTAGDRGRRDGRAAGDISGGGVTRWVAELAFGCRLAIRGGRTAWVRLSLTAVGIGVAVAVLLLACSVPGLMDVRSTRAAGRATPDSFAGVVASPVAGVSPLLVVQRQDQFRDQRFSGYLVEADGPAPPLPPGVDRLPKAGEIVVSPGLARLLSSPSGALLRPRYPQRVVGTIGEEGLLGPDELFFYAGADHLRGQWHVISIYAFGTPRTPAPPLPPLLTLLIALGTVALVTPVLVFLVISTRLAARAHERRLAALRLVGAERAQVFRIAAGEAVVGSLAGAVAGAGLFLLGRWAVARLTGPVFGSGFFAVDLWPGWAPTTAVLVVVPLLAIATAMMSLRTTIIEPLGVVRDAETDRRRLVWRFGPLALAVLLLANQDTRQGVGNGIIIGIAAFLLGVSALLPWVVERVVGLLRGGPPSWQLATRRLAIDGASSFRLAGAFGALLAAGVAVQSLLVPVRAAYVRPDPHPNQIQVGAPQKEMDGPARFTTALDRVEGAQVMSVVLSGGIIDARQRRGELHVAPCPVLRVMAAITDCADGDAFVVSESPRPATSPDDAPATGEPVWFLADAPIPDWTTSPQWTVPALNAVAPRAGVSGRGSPIQGILATPGALADARVPVLSLLASMTGPPDDADTVERVRNVIATLDWSAQARQSKRFIVDSSYAAVRTGLALGASVLLVLTLISLFVIAMEQLHERGRAWTVLTATGAPRSLLAWSLLWQTAVPVLLAVLVALPAGLGLGALLLASAGRPVAFDWPGIGALTGTGVLAVLAVTVIIVPALRRVTRLEGLRAE